MTKTRSPDLSQMRRELALHHVQINCTKPGWSASRNSDGFIMTGHKLRHVVVRAYNHIVRTP